MVIDSNENDQEDTESHNTSTLNLLGKLAASSFPPLPVPAESVVPPTPTQQLPPTDVSAESFVPETPDVSESTEVVAPTPATPLGEVSTTSSLIVENSATSSLMCDVALARTYTDRFLKTFAPESPSPPPVTPDLFSTFDMSLTPGKRPRSPSPPQISLRNRK